MVLLLLWLGSTNDGLRYNIVIARVEAYQRIGFKIRWFCGIYDDVLSFDLVLEQCSFSEEFCSYVLLLFSAANLCVPFFEVLLFDMLLNGWLNLKFICI